MFAQKFIRGFPTFCGWSRRSCLFSWLKAMYWPSARSSIIATLRSRPLQCKYDSISLKDDSFILPTTTSVLVGQRDQRVQVATGFVERNHCSLAKFEISIWILSEPNPRWRWHGGGGHGFPGALQDGFNDSKLHRDRFAVCQGRRFAVSKRVRMINTSPGTKQSCWMPFHYFEILCIVDVAWCHTCGSVRSKIDSLAGLVSYFSFPIILLMAEILHHLGWCWNPINNGKNYRSLNWCRISAINSSSKVGCLFGTSGTTAGCEGEYGSCPNLKSRCCSWVVASNIHPYAIWGRWTPILTSIFFKGVGSTTN